MGEEVFAMNDEFFRPISKESQIGKKEKKPKYRNSLQAKSKDKKKPKQRKPLQAKTKINPKRKTPRKKDKTRTATDSKYKKPTLKKRGEFGGEYDKAIELHGEICGEVINPSNVDDMPRCNGWLEMHHVKFKSGQGRGKKRNGRPLCETHHKFAHQKKWYAEKWREIHKELYGEHYYMDEWDLYSLSLISEPTEKAFEEFMEGVKNGES